MRAILRQIIAAGLVAAAAAPALAQRSSGTATVAPRSDSSSTTNINTVGDDGTTVQLTIRDKDVTAFVDGKRVPQERIEQDGKTIRILSEDGSVIKEFLVANPGGGGVWTTNSGDRLHNRMIARVDTEPRAFMGVMLGDVDETAAAQLGLDPEKVVTITSVTDGLAAQKAGLRAHDIVIQVEGADGASGASLREALAARKPGDSIDLQVLRGGQKQTVTVTLGEAPAATGFAFAPDDVAEWNVELDDSGPWALKLDELRSQMDRGRAAWEEAMAQLHEEWEGLDLKLSDSDRVKLEAAMERLQESLENLDVEIDGPVVRFFGNGDRRAVVAPTPPGAPAAPSVAGAGRAQAGTYRFVPGTAATEEMDQRLKGIEERMNRIEALLEKLAEKD